MREILFRGKTYNDKWVQGLLVQMDDRLTQIRKLGNNHRSGGERVMAGCRDCFHRFLCSILESKGYQQDCRQFVDRSLFVVLPCKVGDTLYTVVRGYKIREWIVTDMCFSDYFSISVKVIIARNKRNRKHIRFADHCLGKTVFLTREEAEQALKEREKNGQGTDDRESD